MLQDDVNMCVATHVTYLRYVKYATHDKSGSDEGGKLLFINLWEFI